MDKNRTIPSPAWLKWREFRIDFLPVILFVAALASVFVLWKREVAAPNIVREVEMLAGREINPADGLAMDRAANR